MKIFFEGQVTFKKGHFDYAEMFSITILYSRSGNNVLDIFLKGNYSKIVLKHFYTFFKLILKYLKFLQNVALFLKHISLSCEIGSILTRTILNLVICICF